MPWTVSQVGADFWQNQGIVIFNNSGGASSPRATVNVTFALTPENMPPAQSITRQDLIAQAQQILIDAGNSQFKQTAAATVRRSRTRRA